MIRYYYINKKNKLFDPISIYFQDMPIIYLSILYILNFILDFMDFIKKLIKSWGRKYYGEFKLYEPKKIDEIKEIILENTNVIPQVDLEVMETALLIL